MNKKGRIFLVVGIIVCVLGTAGTFGGLYYKAISQLTIEIDKATITGFTLKGTVLNPQLDMDLAINCTISNPTVLTVNVERVDFEIYFEGSFYGSGHTSAITATRTPTPFTVYTQLEDVGGEKYIELYDLLVLGHDKILTMHIVNVTASGITIPLNYNVNQTITQDDIL